MYRAERAHSPEIEGRPSSSTVPDGTEERGRGKSVKENFEGRRMIFFSPAPPAPPHLFFVSFSLSSCASFFVTVLATHNGPLSCLACKFGARIAFC